MRYLWLVGLVAVAGLVLAAGLRAAEEGAPARHEHRATEGAAGAGAGRTRPPAVTLTPEQEAALAPAVTELKAAIAKFKAATTKVLGETDGPAYMRQMIYGQIRTERPKEEKKPEVGTEK